MNYDAVAKLAAQQNALERSVANLVADIFEEGSELDPTRPAHNVVTLSKPNHNGGPALEVQVIVKVGTAHEVRDDLWDALMDRQDIDTGLTEFANAAMERLGYPRPEGGWPK